MKILYVSDLDGTLLNSKQTTSKYTNYVINTLVEKGELFSFATARSYSTAKKATNGISVNIPISVYNGTFIVDNLTGKRLVSNFFENDIADVIKDLLDNGINPIVYSVINGEEKFSFLKINAVTDRSALLIQEAETTGIILLIMKTIYFLVTYFIFLVLMMTKFFCHYMINTRINIAAFFKRIYIMIHTGLNLCRKMLLRQIVFYS